MGAVKAIQVAERSKSRTLTLSVTAARGLP